MKSNPERCPCSKTDAGMQPSAMQGELSRLCTVPYLWTTVIDHLSFLHTSYIWWVHAICPESSLSPVQLSPLDAPTTAITDGRHRSRVTVERSGWGEEDVQGKHTTTLYPMTIDPPYRHRVMVQSPLISVPLIVY